MLQFPPDCKKLAITLFLPSLCARTTSTLLHQIFRTARHSLLLFHSKNILLISLFICAWEPSSVIRKVHTAPRAHCGYAKCSFPTCRGLSPFIKANIITESFSSLNTDFINSRWQQTEQIMSRFKITWQPPRAGVAALFHQAFHRF